VSYWLDYEKSSLNIKKPELFLQSLHLPQPSLDDYIKTKVSCQWFDYEDIRIFDYFKVNNESSVESCMIECIEYPYCVAFSIASYDYKSNMCFLFNDTYKINQSHEENDVYSGKI